MSSVEELDGFLAPAAGLARILGAAAADVVHVVDPRTRPAADPLDLRDPEYIRRTLPALRAMADVYFRAEVRGLETCPHTGRCCSSATTRAAR